MKNQFKILGMIPARYGSTRFPGKPLAMIGNKTLIQRTYENAKKSLCLDDVFVLTDDFRIYEHVLGFNGKVLMTSSECPTGTERIAEAIKNNTELNSFQAIVNIQGDEPFLESDVIEDVVDKLMEDESAMMATAVVKMTNEDAASNPSVTKCVMDQNGNALYFSRCLVPYGHSGKWQPHTTYYKHLGIYCYRRQFLLHYAELYPTPLQIAEDLEQLKVLEHGHRIKVAIVESTSIGIDRPEDIKKVEHLL